MYLIYSTSQHKCWAQGCMCHLGTSLKSNHGRNWVHAFTTIHIQPFPLSHYYGIGVFKLWLASITRKKSSTWHLSLMCSADRCYYHHKCQFDHCYCFCTTFLCCILMRPSLYVSINWWWIAMVDTQNHTVNILWYRVCNVIATAYWLIHWTATNNSCTICCMLLLPKDLPLTEK